MGLLTLLESRASLENPQTPLDGSNLTLVDIFGGTVSKAGRRVTIESARTLAAVYQAIQLIAGDMGALPLKLFQAVPGGREARPQHPAYRRLHDKPNSSKMSAMAFREAAQGWILSRGNFYAEIDYAGRDFELIFLEQISTRFVTDQGPPHYVTGPTQRKILPENVLHIPGLGGDGITGWSVIGAAKEAIGQGLASQDFAGEFYGSGMKQSMILKHPEHLSEQAQELLRKSVERAGSRAHGVLVLEEGLDATQWQISSEDAEWLESRKFNVVEIARFFNVPPHKLRDHEHATFSNIESAQIDYVVSSLTPWLVRWEQALNNQLLSDAERAAGYFFKHEVDGLLRGDPEKRANAIQARFATGSITPNQIRALHDENALTMPGADEAYVPLNYVPLSEAVGMTAQDRALLLAAESGEVSDMGHQPIQRRASPLRVTRERRKTIETFLPLLLDALRRMIRAEQQNLQAGFRYIDRWTEWLEEYYRNEHPAVAMRIVGPTMEGFARAVAAAAGTEVQGEISDADLTRWLMREQIGYVPRFADRYSASSRRQLQKIGRESEDIETDTLARFNEWDEGTPDGRPRADRWADQEANRLGNAVAVEVFAMSGITLVRWNTVSDTCPMCERLNGTIVGVRETFLGKGETLVGTDDQTSITAPGNIKHPPLHAGCDCFTSAE